VRQNYESLITSYRVLACDLGSAAKDGRKSKTTHPNTQNPEPRTQIP
jgi:hypothetical protein